MRAYCTVELSNGLFWKVLLAQPAGATPASKATRFSHAPMCTCRVFCRVLPVLFVTALISWCYYVYTSDILLPMLRLPNSSGQSTATGSHSTGVTYTIVFNLLFSLGSASFLCAIFTDPGRIPDHWVVGSEDAESGAFFPQLHTLETKQDGTRRICRKSKPNVYKPDRAHFCKMLGRCVLKMDHFCPWCAPMMISQLPGPIHVEAGAGTLTDSLDGLHEHFAG